MVERFTSWYVMRTGSWLRDVGAGVVAQFAMRVVVRGRRPIAACLLCLSMCAAAAQEIGPQAFGLHVNRLDHWPQLAVGAIRPANVSWRVINSAPGKFDWTVLDGWVARASHENTELSYLFVGTPQWAASRPSERCYAGPIGCASPPAQWRDWDAFVSALVKRYRGRIQSYEIWNEPNDRQFWTGNMDEMLEMARRAYRIIHTIDPAAIVISPSPTYGRSGPPQAWLSEYLRAGGGAYADVIGFHGYVGPDPQSVVSVVKGIQRVTGAAGLGDKPVWNTEASWGRNTTLKDAAAQQAFLTRSYVLQLSLGVQRFYWYQWDNPEWGTLWSSATGINPAGNSFQTVREWLVGARFVEPCVQCGARRWKCKLSRSGTRFEIEWGADSTASMHVLPPVPTALRKKD